MSFPDLAAFDAAQQRISDALHRTPLLRSTTVATRIGATSFHLKCESLQKTGSFKVRGALNAVLQLDATQRARGVITVSAGNHAQALAWSAARANVRCTVVMPSTASESKAAAAAGYGATVILHGNAHEAFAKADELAATHGYTMVHPFDDDSVLVGAGTVGIEILQQLPGVDVVVVPIGGGGLIAGIAACIKQANPSTQIVGVEPEGAAAMRQSLDAGHPIRLESVQTIADGLAAPYAGKRTYPIVRELVDDVVVVTDDEIIEAFTTILSRCKLLAEPAGAAATAALLAGKIPQVRDRHVVALLSGGNVDLGRMRSWV